MAHVLRPQLKEVTQQPDERRELLGVFLISGFADLSTETLDPNVAIVKIAERGLHSRRALGVGRDGPSPALLEKLDRVTQTLSSNAHLVKRLDFERSKHAIAQLLQLL